MNMHPHPRLLVLVGTVTQTAEGVARAIEMDMGGAACRVEVHSMEGLTPAVFEEDALYVICTSTHGMGDVPGNARAFYDSLDEQPRFLGHVRYGVIALGDSLQYPQTFAQGGRRFDERLQDLGAVRIGDVLMVDASGPDDPAAAGVAWCRQWIAMALAKSA